MPLLALATDGDPPPFLCMHLTPVSQGAGGKVTPAGAQWEERRVLQLLLVGILAVFFTRAGGFGLFEERRAWCQMPLRQVRQK